MIPRPSDPGRRKWTGRPGPVGRIGTEGERMGTVTGITAAAEGGPPRRTASPTTGGVTGARGRRAGVLAAPDAGRKLGGGHRRVGACRRRCPTHVALWAAAPATLSSAGVSRPKRGRWWARPALRRSAVRPRRLPRQEGRLA